MRTYKNYYIGIESIICFAIVGIMAILSVVYSIFPELTFLSFSTSGIMQTFGAIGIGLIVKDSFDVRQITRLINNGGFINLPSIMDAIQKADNNIYERIMESNPKELKKQISKYDNYIKSVKEQELKKFKKTGSMHYNLTDEYQKMHDDEFRLDMFEKINNGECSWRDYYDQGQIEIKRMYVVKYLTGDISEEEKKIIDETVQHITKMRDGGITVNL